MAALTKITNLDGFSDRVVLHSGLPPTLALAVATVVPWLELTCGFCLVFGLAIREAALILTLLLALFLGYALARPYQPDCGCVLFPQALEAANRWPWLPLRNSVLLLCSAWVAWKGNP